MKRRHSIRFRASVIFGLIFVIVIAIGAIGFLWISDFNQESTDIRDRWLQNTRYLGDLANFTSDIRAVEGAFLLTSAEDDVAILRSELQDLDASVAQARKGYERISHDGWEEGRYREFTSMWNTYRRLAGAAFKAGTPAQKAEAVPVYLTSSKRAFATVSDILEQLTNQNNIEAKQASERASETIRKARFFGLLTIAITAAAVLGMLAFITRSLTVPLVELADGMRRLANGDMDIEPHSISRMDELGEMANAVVVFRNNAIELKSNQMSLAHQATMLEEKLAQEQKLVQQHRSFISMASHEFRTPMTQVDGHAQRLINAVDPLTRETVVDRATRIRIAIKRMKLMIDNMLETSKMVDTDPNLYFHPSSFDLRILLQEICTLQRDILPKAPIIEDLRSETVSIYGDRKLLFLAFNNLLANALKYSYDAMPIIVRMTLRDDAVVVEVRGHGIGIPPHDIPHVFERYFRGSNVSGIVGNGIGLYLVKVVADLHNGDIKVESNENDGSCFFVTLPRGIPA